ncbi:4924_t:CDS:2, partial [Funneliformis mosseae]
DDGLDPSHYVSASGMFNDLLYKSSEVELKLMINKDKNLIVKKSIREGMTIAKILEKVDSEEIQYIQSIASNAKIGYTFEVDLEVPVYLHNYFADYPLASEKQIVSEDWLSLYNERLV